MDFNDLDFGELGAIFVSNPFLTNEDGQHDHSEIEADYWNDE